jgi:hypothetical protein
MKKLLLSIFIVSSFASSAQVTVFQDSFENYNDFLITGFGDWLTIDLDGLPTYIGGNDAPADTWSATWDNAGDPQAFMIFNPSTATGELEDGTPSGISNSTASCTTGESRNFDPHTGSKYAASWASVPSTTGGATANADFLVSPLINLGTTNTLQFWVKSLSSCYGAEQFRVYYHLGTSIPTSLADFTVISGIPPVSASGINWIEKTYALNASLDGQQVRFAIQNVGSDHYMMLVDDFLVTAAALGTNDVLAAKFSVYPNPINNVVNVTNSESIRINSVVITDLNGRTIKSNTFADAINDIQINVSDLSSGVYMMNINSDQGKAVKKIVKN